MGTVIREPRRDTRLHQQTMTDPYQFVQGGGIGITAAMPLRRDIGALRADLCCPVEKPPPQ